MNDDQLFLFFNRIESKLDKMAETSAAETARWNECRITDKENVKNKLDKKVDLSLAKWILSGIGAGLVFIFLMSLDLRDTMSHVKTELSVHMGTVVKSHTIDIKGVIE